MFIHDLLDMGTEFGIYTELVSFRRLPTTTQLTLYSRSSSSILMASILLSTKIAGM